MAEHIKAVMYCGGLVAPDSEWRISWVPGQPKFEIESLNGPSMIVRWQMWSVVYNDTIEFDQHDKAYQFAEELFERCIKGEIAYEGG